MICLSPSYKTKDKSPENVADVRITEISLIIKFISEKNSRMIYDNNQPIMKKANENEIITLFSNGENVRTAIKIPANVKRTFKSLIFLTRAFFSSVLYRNTSEIFLHRLFVT